MERMKKGEKRARLVVWRLSDILLTYDQTRLIIHQSSPTIRLAQQADRDRSDVATIERRYLQEHVFIKQVATVGYVCISTTAELNIREMGTTVTLPAAVPAHVVRAHIFNQQTKQALQEPAKQQASCPTTCVLGSSKHK